jgi:hypothetical protein
LTVQCTAFKRNTERCTLPANGPQGLCWAHDPANAEKRRRGASRGGKAKANRELPSIKARLEDLTERVPLRRASDRTGGRSQPAHKHPP